MDTEFECEACHNICVVDGDYPKFFCWCDVCHNYAKGFNDAKYAADCLAYHIESATLNVELANESKIK